MSRKRIALWVAVAAVAATVLILSLHPWRSRLITIQGAVIRRTPTAADTRGESPVAGVLVTASQGSVSISTYSDASGYFKIVFPQVVWPGQTVNLNLSAPNYRPLHLRLRMTSRAVAKRLIVAALQPLASQTMAPVPGKPDSLVSNIRIRYTVNSKRMENVGSAVKTFQVVNQGNVPCKGRKPCSPDGEWKAASKTVTMDAGVGNAFHDVRVTCIAGPCPFTRIDPDGGEPDERKVTVTATDWSDTATFLFEAAVYQAISTSNVREIYPTIFDRNLNFTLPPTQEGVSIEAEINGVPILFPLGPDIYLDWADCNERIDRNSGNSIVYACALKPGYKF